jgi:hypothetical protein
MPGVSVLASDSDYLSVTVGGTASDFHRLALCTPVTYSFAVVYHNADKTASFFTEDWLSNVVYILYRSLPAATCF